jgi:tight adherence protein B
MGILEFYRDNPQLGMFIALGAFALGFLAYSITSSLAAGAEEYSRRFTKSAEATLDEMFVFMPSTWILTMKLSCSLVAALFAAALFAALPPLQLLVPALAFAVPAFFVPDIMIKRAHRNRIRKFHMQMIDALTVISNSMKSGLSFQDAMKMMTEELRDPIAGEFRLVLREISIGQSQERSLENLTRRIPLEDLTLFVASINAVHRMGKGIPEICERALHVIEERFRIERHVETLTAEGKMQAFVLTSAPFVLMLALFFIDPNLIWILFNTFAGIIILITVIFLDVIGFIIIRRITTIDV